MDPVYIKSPWIEGEFLLDRNKRVQISIVAYEHPTGMPARFCAGLIPAIVLAKQAEGSSEKSIIRIIDPSPIANYCNGWVGTTSAFQSVIARFLGNYGVNYFFDRAEEVTPEMLEVLESLGSTLQIEADKKIGEMVARITESGRRHGGESGVRNALLYMAAHPFSWLDMYHPRIWQKEHRITGVQFVNLMSKPESRFTVVRKFLQERRPDLCTQANPTDLFMTVCNTPCYIPIEGEPLLADLTDKGYEWCHTRYYEMRKESGNHRRAYKDFESLYAFINGT
jgi:hypothetical protein